MNLKFGTGGLRAIMGEGPDCLNIGTIQEATLGVANYIKKKNKQPDRKSTRLNSSHANESRMPSSA